MKRKITVQLPEGLLAHLEADAESSGASKSAIVEAALDSFLSSEAGESAALLQRLDEMGAQLEQIGRHLEIVSETAALHARYHLTIAPPLANSEHQAACALGRERFEVFAAQVAMRLRRGTPLMAETMEKLSAQKPNSLRPEADGVVPLGDALPDREGRAPVLSERSESSAAAPEGGSDECFREAKDR